MSAYADLFDPGPVQASKQPATEKQIAYARAIAARTGQRLGTDMLQDRSALSVWIETHKVDRGAFGGYPSSKQVAFAERIARLKRRHIPDECFRDRTLMSRWIDGNKPR